MNRHSQKGSALLIVLGFLSFMVVSAVAFAIWMRNERMPSSALRRSVANRYLVKAALAQAMSRLDDAIRSHVYPGTWNTNDQNTVYRDRNNCAYDWWESRIFMPPDPEGEGTESGDPYSRYAPVTKTVSVLNMEALGYLPPAIANDVRLLSRSSWAAKWDYFNFDAGRYAFCAVNVSDMLDISKIAADAPRTTAAAEHAKASGQKPAPSRFSLAYLLRSDDNNFSSPNGMSDLDRFIHIAPGQGEWTTAPLVSIMDYNLSVGQGVGNLRSPFYDNASGDNSTRFFYGAASRSSPLVKNAERQPFVTASWFPDNSLVPSDGSTATPLNLARTQPFKAGTMSRDGAGMQRALFEDMEPDFWTVMMKNGRALTYLDMCTLHDYLDYDDVPVSLAMPCAERVPMLTALAPLQSSSIKVEFVREQTPRVEQGSTPTERKKIYDTKIKVTTSSCGLSSTLLFPFTSDGRPAKSFEAQAYARLVFVGEEQAQGGGNAAASLSMRNNGFARNFRPNENWNKKEDPFKLDADSGNSGLPRTEAENCLLVTLPALGSEPVSLGSKEIQNVDDSWENKLLAFEDVTAEGTILSKIEYYKVIPPTEQNPQESEELQKTVYQILLRPFDTAGNVIEVPTTEMEETEFNTLCQKYTMRPHLVTWARVTQGGKTVDMVPASYADDRAFNNVNNADVLDEVSEALGNAPATGDSARWQMPIISFPGNMAFTYANAQAGTAVPDNEWLIKSCYTVDPRFNWAPENWLFDENDANVSGQKWRDKVFGTNEDGKDDSCVINKLVKDEFDGSVTHRGDRARDPFLFVSNQGYLQSVGELVFLPHVSDMDENSNPASVLGKTKTSIGNSGSEYNVYNGSMRMLSADADCLSIPCALSAWKSYQSYRTNPNPNAFEFGANMYRRGLVNGSQGFYVNPYTQSQEIMLAALANTPLNYWVTSTNAVARGNTVATFNDYRNSMFSDGSSRGVQMRGQDVKKIATFLRRRLDDIAAMIRTPASMGDTDLYIYQKVWEDLFDALDWGGTMEEITVEKVYDALTQYYAGGGSGGRFYRNMYMEGNGNGYSRLNQFARGGGKKGMGTSITLDKSYAVHKGDFSKPADPLRAEYDGSSATTCYREFYDIDRKFLHSYWRDCFANRQQLFLIFVRAESTALGGAGEGTPAQQGGRAVALVWRDPMATTGGGIYENDDTTYQERRRPHKMRILFYRQFD